MRTGTAVGVVCCLLGWLAMACKSSPTTPTSAPLPSASLTPALTWTPMPGSLTDAAAIALVEEEAASRGVDLFTLRITIAGEPRRASIRYSSSFDVDSNIFQVQTTLVALTAARVMTRVQPPLDGGMRLAVMPGGESEVGLKVIIIDGSSLEAWANGSISDQDFVAEWTVGSVTIE